MDCLLTSTGSRPKPRLAAEFGRSFLVLCAGAALAGSALAQPRPLAPDKAFRFDARALNPQTVEARFTIADGYYLYRDRIHFSVEPATVPLTVSPLPPGKIKDDEFFGRVETYRGGILVNLALKDTVPGQKRGRRRRVAGLRRSWDLLSGASAACHRCLAGGERCAYTPGRSRAEIVVQLTPGSVV